MAKAVLIFLFVCCILASLTRADEFKDSAFLLFGKCTDDASCDKRCHDPKEYEGVTNEYNKDDIPDYVKYLSGTCNWAGTDRCGCHVRLPETIPSPNLGRSFGKAIVMAITLGTFGLMSFSEQAKDDAACAALAPCGEDENGCKIKGQLLRSKEKLCYCPKSCDEKKPPPPDNNAPGSGGVRKGGPP
ncbi:uncharacterized protein J3D65DRAFT_670207 [Phyllosticta citribraziliensis]|uniref:Uncharacterized protein n=1 Tax=Phyllosticta citribraziliensis TaxID=989973 RepID=A0ABR1LGV3_9PEZI